MVLLQTDCRKKHLQIQLQMKPKMTLVLLRIQLNPQTLVKFAVVLLGGILFSLMLYSKLMYFYRQQKISIYANFYAKNVMDYACLSLFLQKHTEKPYFISLVVVLFDFFRVRLTQLKQTPFFTSVLDYLINCYLRYYVRQKGGKDRYLSNTFE